MKTHCLIFPVWPKRLGAMLKTDDSTLYPAIVSTMVALIYLGSLAPQLTQVATATHLARPYLAPLVGKPVKLVRYRALLDVLLSRIGPHDVVLSDRQTSWMIPSSRGRIVAALHYEFFVKGQAERAAAMNDFFNEATSDKRRLEVFAHVRRALDRAEQCNAATSACRRPDGASSGRRKGRFPDAPRRRGLGTATFHHELLAIRRP